MIIECDWCGETITSEQAVFTFRNYHEILCPECAAYVSKKQIEINKSAFF